MGFVVEDVEAAETTADSLLDWLNVLGWPIAVIVIALALFVPRSSVFRNLFRNTNLGTVKVAAFGAEVELTQEAKSQNERLLDSALSEFREGTQALYRQFAYEVSVDQLFAPLWSEVERLVRLGQENDADFSKLGLRGVLYVEHALLRDYLIQLTDYRPAGGGRGRAFSMRFGIVGEAWRAENSRFHSLSDQKEKKEHELVQRFGFSAVEAKANRKSREHESFAGVFAKGKGGIPLLVLYLDADGAEVFDDDLIVAIENFVKNDCEHLLNAVDTVQRRVKSTVPHVRIPDDQHI